MIARLTVLILDDDAEFAALVGDLVERRQHSACLVHDLEAAWRQLATSPPDVLLADYHIGRRSSGTLLAAIHDVFPAVRCVLVSGADCAQADALLARGLVSGMLRKPFSVDELFALVEASPSYRSRRSSGPR